MDRDYDDEFIIKAENGEIYYKIIEVFGFPQSTSGFGGYDTQSSIEIKSSNYYVKGSFFITTAELFSFYKELEICFSSLQGSAKLSSYEGNLQLTIEMDGLGHARIYGMFRERMDEDNELSFELKTDQTYLFQPLSGLRDIVSVYGNENGINMK